MGNITQSNGFDFNPESQFTNDKSTLVTLSGSIVTSNPTTLQNLVNSTAGTMTFTIGNDCLNPLAKNRLIAIKNTGNQSVTVKVFPGISSIGTNSSNVSIQLTLIANGGVQYITDGQLNEIKAPFDTLTIGVSYATLPTSGGVSVTIQEVVGS